MAHSFSTELVEVQAFLRHVLHRGLQASAKFPGSLVVHMMSIWNAKMMPSIPFISYGPWVGSLEVEAL